MHKRLNSLMVSVISWLLILQLGVGSVVFAAPGHSDANQPTSTDTLEEQIQNYADQTSDENANPPAPQDVDYVTKQYRRTFKTEIVNGQYLDVPVGDDTPLAGI